jgi:hypothetical protein
MKVFHCEATSKKNRTIEPRGETGKCWWTESRETLNRKLKGFFVCFLLNN